jgi:hypothetical protein
MNICIRTTTKEANKMAQVLGDKSLEKLFKDKLIKVDSNQWLFNYCTFDKDAFEDMCMELTDIFISKGLDDEQFEVF